MNEASSEPQSKTTWFSTGLRVCGRTGALCSLLPPCCFSPKAWASSLKETQRFLRVRSVTHAQFDKENPGRAGVHPKAIMMRKPEPLDQGPCGSFKLYDHKQHGPWCILAPCPWSLTSCSHITMVGKDTRLRRASDHRKRGTSKKAPSAVGGEMNGRL